MRLGQNWKTDLFVTVAAALLIAGIGRYARHLRLPSVAPNTSHRTQQGLPLHSPPSRSELARVLKIEDLIPNRRDLPLDAVIESTQARGAFVIHQVTVNTSGNERVELWLGIPKGAMEAGVRLPAVISLAGHGYPKEYRKVFNKEDPVYRGFAAGLTERGFVTLAIGVRERRLREASRTFLGERLFNLMRSVDYLESLPFVDSSRIGVGGISLGGQMAMWLGAMDSRIRAVSVSSFLTFMENLSEKGLDAPHCDCWFVEGLPELADFPDIYRMIAPRPLFFQISRKFEHASFSLEVSDRALNAIRPAYARLDRSGNLSSVVHDEGHVVVPESLYSFFLKNLGK